MNQAIVVFSNAPVRFYLRFTLLTRHLIKQTDYVPCYVVSISVFNTGERERERCRERQTDRVYRSEDTCTSEVLTLLVYTFIEISNSDLHFSMRTAPYLVHFTSVVTFRLPRLNVCPDRCYSICITQDIGEIVIRLYSYEF